MILNHLWTILEIDSSKAEKGIRDTQKSTDDLVKEFEKSEKAGNKSFNSLTAVATKLLGAIVAAGAAAKAVSGTIELATATADLGDMADNLDVAVSKLDMFQKTMYATGGTTQGALSTINTLTERLGKGFQNAEGPIAKTLGSLGIGLKDAQGNAKDAVDVITELSGALEGMARPQAFAALQQLGITDPKVIENILKGRKELEYLFRVEKERGLIGDKEVERARKLTDAQDRLRAGISRLSDSFLGKLIPVISTVIEWLDKMVAWAGQHEDVITGFFIAIGTVLAVLYIPSMIAAAAATLAATWPLLLMIAAVAAVAAAFALAYDDVMNFIDGNDSLIGQIFEKFPLIKDLVYMVIDAFKYMATAIQNAFSSVWESLKTIFNFIYDGVNKVIGVLGKIPFMKGMTSAFSAGQGALELASSSPMNSQTSAAISNAGAISNSNSVQIGQLTVETKATDAKGIAQDTRNELSTQLRDLQSENKSGVVR